MPQGFARSVFTIFFIAFSVLVLFMTIGTYWTNYSHSDGVALPNHEVVGGDFLCFYVAGENATANVAGLYDFDRSHLRQQQIIGGRNVHTGYLPYAYPPLLALLFSALSRLSFQSAYLVWLLFSVVLSSLAIIFVLSKLKSPKSAKCMFFAASFAFVPLSINCLGGGQTSCLGLFAFALVYFLLKSNRDFAAGIALALSYYKPPIFLVFLLFVFLHRRWRMLAGFCLMAITLVLGSILMIGASGFLGYIQKVSHYTYGHEIVGGLALPPNLGVGLYALLMRLTPTVAGLLFCFVAVLLMLTTYIVGIHAKHEEREGESFDLLFALEVTLSVLLSLQLLYYDLTILLVPIVIVGSRLWMSAMNWIKILSLTAIVGLYTEFAYRESLATITPIKAATVIIFTWVVLLMISLSRHKRDDPAVVYSQ